MYLRDALFILAATQSALGAISLGEWRSGGKNVAWTSGVNPCNNFERFSIINNKGDNPCGAGEFKVDDSWYKLEGCGGTDFKIVRTHPGGWEAKCSAKSWFCGGLNNPTFSQSWQCN